MFYIVYFNRGKLIGFITDDEEIPIAYESEAMAREAIRGHILEHFSKIIEI